MEIRRLPITVLGENPNFTSCNNNSKKNPHHFTHNYTTRKTPIEQRWEIVRKSTGIRKSLLLTKHWALLNRWNSPSKYCRSIDQSEFESRQRHEKLPAKYTCSLLMCVQCVCFKIIIDTGKFLVYHLGKNTCCNECIQKATLVLALL